MKKKILSLCLVAALVLTAIGGATLAYFTDNDTKTNTFTIGNIDIAIGEMYGVKGPDDEDINDAVKLTMSDDGTIVTGLEYSNLMPSYDITKEPFIKNMSDRNDAYVRVAVVVNNYTKINDAIDNVYEGRGYDDEDMNDLYDTIFKGWGIEYTKCPIRGSMSKRNAEIGVDNNGATLLGIDYVRGVSGQYQSGSEGTNYMEEFYYGAANGRYYENAYKADSRLYVFYLKLEAGKSYTLFEGLNIPPEFTNDQMQMFDGLEIGIYADAIQTVGFTTAMDAFNALEAEHPIGWWND